MAVAGHSITLERTETNNIINAPCTLSDANALATITNANFRILDPRVSVTVTDNGSPVAAADILIDYPFGRIYHLTGAFTGPVTVSAQCFERFAEVEPISFSADCTTELIDTSLLGEQDMRRAVSGLQTATGQVVVLDTGDNGDFGDSLSVSHVNGSLFALSVEFGSVFFRALVKLTELNRQVATDGRFELTYAWEAAQAKGTGQVNVGNSFGWSDLAG
jgi:hypothetical protein